MPDSYLLNRFPAAISWFIDSLTIRSDDVYAVVGLIAGVALLSLWVAVENLRQTRWLSGDPHHATGATGAADTTGIQTPQRWPRGVVHRAIGGGQSGHAPCPSPC